ncbi:energy transducer TonB [Flavobacterium sp.]|uniref:energy transducer TonB n=1 Tax=Flavobacterium sp. TaxID=239 RepID=UPI00374CDD66
MTNIKLIIILLFIGMSNPNFAQIGGEDEVYLNGDYTEAKFNGGGIEKFHEFVTKGIDYSKMTKSGKIVLTFTISETGEMKNIRISEFPDITMATEVLRVVRTAPKWQSAKRGGKSLSINIKFPLIFSNKKN